MALLALCSAKGSPGTTTAAVALAGLWPRRAVLADLDPAGSDLIWRYRDRAGDPLDPDRGLLSLAASARRTSAGTDLAAHVQQLLGGLEVLAGVSSPEQVTGLGPVWPALAEALVASPDDVLADCGRVVPGSPTMPVLTRADLTVFTVRPGVESFAHLRERLRGLRQPLRLGQVDAARVAVVVITDDRDRRSAPDLQRLLDAESLGVLVVGRLARDDKGAAALGGHWSPRASRSLLVRSARALTGELAAILTGERAPTRA